MGECEACGSPFCDYLECLEPNYGAMADKEDALQSVGEKK